MKIKKLLLSLVIVLSLGLISQIAIPEMFSSSVVQAASVKISKTKYTMNKGETFKLKIKGTNKKVKWSSSNKIIATVNSNGKVKAKKKGTVTITAKVSGKKYKCKINVEEPKISTKQETINVGDTFKLKIKGTSQTITWSSSNKNIAKVNKNGKVTAKNAGIATITAQVGSTKYKCKVIVENNISVYETNAVKTAKRYLEILNFSKEGLISQLKFEKFTDSEIEYAVNNCGANWNQEAYGKAKDYLKVFDFSRERLYSQLEFEGFTKSQIEYALSRIY